jgi:hypothetical protein
MSNSHKHIGKHLECLACQEKINNLQGRISLKTEVPSVDIFMLSLPIEGLGNIKRFPSEEETYLSGRNLTAIPFRQYYDYLKTKREYFPIRSSTISDYVSNECKLLNDANFQDQLTRNNIDDLHRELLKERKDAESHKEEIKIISEKIEILTHILTDTSELKNSMAKVEARLDLLDTFLHKINCKRSHKPIRNTNIV